MAKMANETTPPRPGAAPAAAPGSVPGSVPGSFSDPHAAAGESAAGSERELGFDQVLDRLRQVVGRLEQGNLSLEQALVAFEDGVRLSRRGGEILDLAEQRVELLLRTEDGERRQPLPIPQSAGTQAP